MNLHLKSFHLLVVFVLIASLGCSTIITRLTGPSWRPPDKPLPQIYSGTLFNFRCMFQSEKYDTQGLGGFCLIDVPFSLIADTIILPLTIYDQIKYGSYGTFKPADEKMPDEIKDDKKKAENKQAADKQIPDALTSSKQTSTNQTTDNQGK